MFFVHRLYLTLMIFSLFCKKIAIMASIVNEKSEILESSIDQSNDMLSHVVAVDRSDEETDIEQWNSEFGLQSGTTYHSFFVTLRCSRS